MPTIENVIENNKRNSAVISSLSAELLAIKNELCIRKKQQLKVENEELTRKIEMAKAQLIALEVKNGKRQIQIPGTRNLCTEAISQQQQVPAPSKENKSSAANVEQQTKTVKEKKTKKPAAATNAATPATEAPIDVGRLDMRVGKIIEVNRHPDADSLYIEKIDCGEGQQPRTVVSGLVKFVPLEEMQNRMVVILCNLKPAKMRGVTSEAMVMCASSPEKVEVLSPPENAEPGDLVHCEGYTRNPDAQLNPKKKIFELCAPDLMTNDQLVACYKGAALHVPGKGQVKAQTLKSVHVK